VGRHVKEGVGLVEESLADTFFGSVVNTHLDIVQKEYGRNE